MILLLSMLPALAAPTGASLTAGGSAHPGVPGQPSAWVGAWGSTGAGALNLEGDGQLSWRDGMAADLYVLTADGVSRDLSFTVGRQRLLLPGQPRLLDGAQATWDTPAMELTASAGIARAWAARDGVAMARLTATREAGPARLEAGLWTEATDTDAQLHPELSARLESGDIQLRSQVMGALSAEDTVLELLRVEARGRPAAGVDMGVHIEHRQAPPLLTAASPAILAIFSPEGLDELGAVVGVSGRARGRATFSGSARTWQQGDLGREYGVAASASLRPAGPSWMPTPSWRFAAGPLGTVHLLSASAALPLPEPLQLRVHGGGAPYLEPFSTWDVAWWTGLSAGLRRGDWQLSAGGDVGRSELSAFDPRAWLVVQRGLR
jgi:hypothetical protein